MHSKLSIIFLTCIILPLSGSASEWKRIEGKFTLVDYPQNYEATADTLLKIAELSIPRLAKMAGLPLNSYKKNKAHIILTDAPDISNGYAIGYDIVIYALSSMYIPYWTGNDSWYKMVLTHELVHHTVFRKTRRKLNAFGIILDMSVPRWFHEGLAQYFAETWNLFRGDIVMKNALLSGNLTFANMDNTGGGGLTYPAGHAFVRFLAMEYGDSSLIKLMSYENDGWFYDFDEAFKSIYDKTPQELFPDFIRHMIIYYGDKLAGYPVNEFFKELPNSGLNTFQMIPLSAEDSTNVVSVKLDAIHNYNTAQIMRIGNDKVETIKTISNNFATDLIVSPDKRYLAYGRYEVSPYENQTSVLLRWFVYDIQTDETIHAVKSMRARYGAFTHQNELILCDNSAAGSVVKKINFLSGKIKTVFRTSMPVGRLAITAQNKIIFTAQRNNGNRDLFVWDNNNIYDLTNDAIDDRAPAIINDSLIAFNRIENENITVALLHLNNGRIETRIDDQFAYWLQSYDAGSKELLAYKWGPKRKRIFTSINIDTLKNVSVSPDPQTWNPKYAGWARKMPHPLNLFPLPDTTIQITKRERLYCPQFNLMHLMSAGLPFYTQENGWGLFGTTAWMEAMQRQTLQATLLIYPQELQNSLILIGHQLKAYNLNLGTSLYYGPAIFAYENGKHIQVNQTIFSFSAGRNFYLNGNPRLTLSPSISYAGYHYKFAEQLAYYPESYSYHGPSISLGFRYLLPTRLYPAIPKKLAALKLRLFKSFDKSYDFSISRIDLTLGTNLYWEALGLITHFNYSQTAGSVPPLNRMGIDRYYELDFPRDVTYTKTVRGIREDIQGKRMIWSSTQLTYMISQESDLKLLFVPLQNLAISAFFDYANIAETKETEVHSYGAEFSFGVNILRFGAGYAFGTGSDKKERQTFYGRVSVFLP